MTGRPGCWTNTVKIVNPNFNPAAVKPAGPDQVARNRVLTDFVTDLLKLIRFIATQTEPRESQEFCNRLSRFGADAASENDPAQLDNLRRTCLRASEDFFEYWRRHLHERDQEFRDLIEILMTAVQTINRDNQNFNATLAQSNARLNSYCDLSDIRDLKLRLREEVTSLQNTIQEKQSLDQTQAAEFDRRISALQARLQVVEQQAATDGLTGIYNRATLDLKLRDLVSRSQSFVLAMFDIDNFKQINDQYGHQVGDQVIIATARALKEATRSNDFVARYGGEEFVVLHLGSRAALSMPRFNYLLENLARTPFSFPSLGLTKEITFTLSCGLTQFRSDDSVETLISRADTALYQAKKQGKNRLIVG